MAKLGLSAPWVEFYRQVEALFRRDSGVKVIYDEANRDLRLYVEDGKKAAALLDLLPTEKKFGRVTLRVTVVPANGVADGWEISDLFKGNRAVDFIQETHGITILNMTYVVFKKEVVQYFTDDLGDYFGMKSTLYEDLAREILDPVNGVYYCTNNVTTEPAANLGAPLGEWP